MHYNFLSGLFKAEVALLIIEKKVKFSLFLLITHVSRKISVQKMITLFMMPISNLCAQRIIKAT